MLDKNGTIDCQVPLSRRFFSYDRLKEHMEIINEIYEDKCYLMN